MFKSVDFGAFCQLPRPYN